MFSIKLCFAKMPSPCTRVLCLFQQPKYKKNIRVLGALLLVVVIIYNNNNYDVIVVDDENNKG